ncbi:hypothetical protein F4808DRAFT_434005 [Astrocystis sublimbata]|nr:hypothetical protein F4808DRAFT_434005 [Astrocystis sublimbata]
MPPQLLFRMCVIYFVYALSISNIYFLFRIRAFYFACALSISYARFLFACVLYA